MRTKLLIAFFIILIKSSYGTNYYTSTSGNDNANGLSPATPWKSITKLSLELGGPSTTWGTITDGDSIFFKRGEIFRGQIEFQAYNNNGITFSSYGFGAAPIIKGSTQVNGWTKHSGDIWKANVTQKVNFLFLNDKLQTLARTPNTGYWFATSSSGTSITNSLITSSGLNFVGANICLREYDWRINRQTISSQSGNTVNWLSGINAANTGANFYFDNKLNFIDTDGEWYCDTTTLTLYYKVPAGKDPNSLNIEAGIYHFGIHGNDNRSKNTIINLTFTNFAESAVYLKGASNNNIVQNCSFSNNFQAIMVSGANNNISNNTISNSFNNGITAPNFSFSTMYNNNVKKTGVIFGLHRPWFSGDFITTGINIVQAQNTCFIKENIVDSVGYVGIKFDGHNITIEKNIVTNTLLNMDDGGAIYTYGANSYNCTVQNNIVHNVVGDHNGTSPSGIMQGIYIDNFANNILIKNNTISNVELGSGIVINAGAHDCIIKNNVTYKCNVGLQFADWQTGASIYNNTVDSNVFYANITTASPIQIASDDNNYNTMSSSNHNYLCNPYSSTVVTYIWSKSQNFTLAQWRTATNLDNLSKESFYNWVAPTDNSFLVTNQTNAYKNHTYTNVVDLDNNLVSTLTLSPYSSKVLINTNITGITENSTQENTVLISPNPSNAILNIKSDFEIERISVQNIVGEEMNCSFENDKLNISMLPNGTYIISILSNKKISNLKFVKI